MCSKVYLVLIVCLVPIVLSKTLKYPKNQLNSLYKIRCDLMCMDRSRETKAKCKSECRTNEKKPGTCPASDTPEWEKACVTACNSDWQCDGTQRCCHHKCGSTCSEPSDLLVIAGLPAMPVLEEPKEKKRAVVIKWSDGVGDAARAVPGQVYYLLEEQHHLGPKFDETKLGQWNLLLRTNKTKVSLRNALKPGRWYRFRVAAVSASGSRGFSAPSSPFTPRRGPRPPPAPKKLKVRHLRFENGTVTVRLEWKEPNSDIPILRYKVFWSRRVKGLSGDLDSVLVSHQSVSKHQKYIDIKDLLPNSMYFLQVQSISQFGLGKLRSEKASIFYNTTSLPGQAERQTAERNDLEPVAATLKMSSKRVTGLTLHRLVWYNNKLKAFISWKSPTKPAEVPERYYVHWKPITCKNPKKVRKDALTATTEMNDFELYELDYQCTYKVIVNSSSHVKTAESELTITVPGCEFLKSKVNGSAIVCEKKENGITY